MNDRGGVHEFFKETRDEQMVGREGNIIARKKNINHLIALTLSGKSIVLFEEINERLVKVTSCCRAVCESFKPVTWARRPAASALSFARSMSAAAWAAANAASSWVTRACSAASGASSTGTLAGSTAWGGVETTFWTKQYRLNKKINQITSHTHDKTKQKFKTMNFKTMSTITIKHLWVFFVGCHGGGARPLKETCRPWNVASVVKLIR